MRSMRGVALVLVLWLIALLAGLVAAFVWVAQAERLGGHGVSRGLVAQESARAGVEYALVQLQRADRRRWAPDGRDYDWTFEGAEVTLTIRDESGKVDLNLADMPLLERLLARCEATPDQARALAAAIVDWRDGDPLSQPGGAEDPQYEAAGLPYGAKDALFSTVAEVQQVLGMTPSIFARCAEYLTVHSGRNVPDERFAAAAVLQAMNRNPRLPSRLPQGMSGPEVPMGSGTYSIRSRAEQTDGSRAELRVVIRTGTARLPGSAYAVLQWEEGSQPR